MKIEKYDINIDNETICSNLDRLINQIYKLLPDREEGIDGKVLLPLLWKSWREWIDCLSVSMKSFFPYFVN